MPRNNNSTLDAIRAFGLTYGIGRNIRDDMVRSDVGDAAQSNQVTESVSGDAALKNFQENYVPQEGGPATAAEYLLQNPDIMASMGSGRKASFDVGSDKFDSKAAAQSQANARNTQAAADVYAKNGMPEEAQRLRLQALQMRGVEQKQADDDELRGALATGKFSVANSAPVRNEALRSSISTGADITGASSVPELAGPVEDVAAGQPVQAPQTKAAPQQRRDFDYYRKVQVPNAVQVLLKQGRVSEAKQLTDFVDAEEGKAHATEWLSGVRSLEIGDYPAALGKFQALYNRQGLNDGHTVQLTPLEGGRQYRIDQISADGQVLGSKTGNTADLANTAASALSPLAAVRFHAERQAQRDKEAALLDRQIQVRQLDVLRDENREDRRDERLAMRLQAKPPGGLTLTQQKSNLEIDAAREAVAGMDPAEIRRRTAKTTNTGRENPDFDPSLERAARLASRRKVGADDVFDKGNGTQPAEQSVPAAAAIDRADVAKRFRGDPKANGHTLGKELHTGIGPDGKPATGYPVIDKYGRVVGVFN